MNRSAHLFELSCTMYSFNKSSAAVRQHRLLCGNEAETLGTYKLADKQVEILVVDMTNGTDI